MLTQGLAAAPVENTSWLMSWALLCFLGAGQFGLRKLPVHVSIIIFHPCRVHVLIFGPRKNSFVSAENEAHLGEKWGSILFGVGEGDTS